MFTRSPFSLCRDIIQRLRQVPVSTWPRALVIGAVAAVVLAVPSDLINTPIFYRPVPPRTFDYLVLASTAALIGLVLAIRPERANQASAGSTTTTDEPSTVQQKLESRTLMSGFASYLAIGCPVCNQVVVALVGTSGALSLWAPIQPLIGVMTISVLLFSLHRRLATYELNACPLPLGSPSA